MKTIDQADLSGKKVLIRIDANVPISGKVIRDNYRLKIALPTISFVLERGASVILMAHLGQPDGKVDPLLSLAPVYVELGHLLKKEIKFASLPVGKIATEITEKIKPGEIVGLENLRFDLGEQTNAKEFAEKLAAYGDIYVNDAFSVSHRPSASIVGITKYLPSYAGLLFEQEYKVLSNLLRHPAKPLVAIIGGAKIKDKLPVIDKLLHTADRILVGGGVANTFLAAQGVDVKRSLVDEKYLDKARKILKHGLGKVILPVDFVYQDDSIVDIGVDSIKLFQKYIKGAKSVFWNGNLGVSELAKGRAGSVAIANALVEGGATTIIAGGNTIELCNSLELTNKMSFASSGGGATLEFLSGQVLPGVKALDTD